MPSTPQVLTKISCTLSFTNLQLSFIPICSSISLRLTLLKRFLAVQKCCQNQMFETYSADLDPDLHFHHFQRPLPTLHCGFGLPFDQRAVCWTLLCPNYFYEQQYDVDHRIFHMQLHYNRYNVGTGQPSARLKGISNKLFA